MAERWVRREDEIGAWIVGRWKEWEGLGRIGEDWGGS